MQQIHEKWEIKPAAILLWDAQWGTQHPAQGGRTPPFSTARPGWHPTRRVPQQGCTQQAACSTRLLPGSESSFTLTCFGRLRNTWIKIHPSPSFYLHTLAVYLIKKACTLQYFFLPFFSWYVGVGLFLWSLYYWMTATALNASPITWNVFILLFWKMKRILCVPCIRPKSNWGRTEELLNLKR